MTVPDPADALEAQIEQWRSHLRRHEVIHSFDLEELEDRLREHIAALRASGLRDDEAFLVAAKRVGEGDARARSFAREHAQRQWKQLGATSGTGGMEGAGIRREAVVAFGLAVLAALALKAPELFGLKLDEHPGFYARNLALFVLPFLAAYFVWKRKPDAATRGGLVAAFIAAAVVANAHAYAAAPDLEVLTAIHLPIALWLAVGVAYAGGRWREAGVRMDFVRFSGELFIYYVLIALGGVVLTGTMLAMFSAIGFDMEPLFERFILPCGAAGAVLVGAWLVEAKQGVIESIAPVLTRLFTPLFALLLVAFLATMAWSGRAFVFHRDLLIACDLLLVIVLGLLVYSISARTPGRPPGVFDLLQVVLVACALLVDVLALWTIAARIGELGLTPNRVAALGENVILLANLSWSAVLYLRFLRGRGEFAALERWQTRYLPVYAVWAAIVVVVFPPLFGMLRN